MNQALETRIRKIELRNRLLLGLFAVLAVFLLLGRGGTSDDSKTLVCQRLEVVDEGGKVIAVLGVDAEGSRGLFVYDAENQLRLANIHDSVQTAFYALDTEGTIRLGVAQYAHGGGGLALHGPNSKGATVLYHQVDGNLTFYDDEGEVVKKISGK